MPPSPEVEDDEDEDVFPMMPLPGCSSLDPRLRVLLRTLAEHHRRAGTRREKHKLLAMVLEAKQRYRTEHSKKMCSLRELRECGFQVSNTQVKTVKSWMGTEEYLRMVKPEQELEVGLPRAPKLGKPASPHVALIEQFFYRSDISHVSGNATMKLGDAVVPVRHLYQTLSKTFAIWKEDISLPSISLSTFRKYKPVDVVKPHSSSEACLSCIPGGQPAPQHVMHREPPQHSVPQVLDEQEHVHLPPVPIPV